MRKTKYHPCRRDGPVFVGTDPPLVPHPKGRSLRDVYQAQVRISCEPLVKEQKLNSVFKFVAILRCLVINYLLILNSDVKG